MVTQLCKILKIIKLYIEQVNVLVYKSYLEKALKKSHQTTIKRGYLVVTTEV